MNKKIEHQQKIKEGKDILNKYIKEKEDEK